MTQINPLDRASVILAALIGSAIGALFYNMLPLYLGMAQEYRGLSNPQIGAVGFAFFLGYNLATISGFYWIRRFNWRTIAAVFAPIAALMMMSVAWLHSYPMMLAAVCVAGAAFAGLYGLCATVLGDTSHPARWYGAKIAGESVTGALLFLLLPGLVIERFGFDGMVISLGVLVLVLTPTLWLLPITGSKHQPEAHSVENKIIVPKVAIYLMLGATMLWFCGQTIMWSFVERIGSAAGHSADYLGMVLAGTLVAATTGSLLAAGISDRFGTLRPFLLASLLFLISVPMLSASELFIAYAVGASVVMFSVGFGIPYSFSIIAALDNDGRYTVLVVPAIGIGAMIAPGLAGWLSADGSYQSLLFTASGLVIVAMLFAFRSARSAVSA